MTNDPSVSSKRSLPAILGRAVGAAWKQVTLDDPEVDPQLAELSAVERISEVLRYQLLQLEFSISADGGVRAWLRLNLLIAAVLMIPAVLVVPVLTWIMGSFVTLTEFLLIAAQNLLHTLIVMIVSVSLLLAFVYGVKVFLMAQASSRSSRRR